MTDPTDHTGHHHLHMFEDHRWAVAGAVGMYLVAGLVLVLIGVDSLREAVQPIDDGWHEWMVAIEWAPLTVLSELLDVVGSTYVTAPIRLGVASWLAWSRRWAALTTWVIVIVVSDAAIGVLKRLYERPRPPDGLVETSGFSFPSGHAMATAATAVALVIVLLPPGVHRRVWEVRAGTFAFVMALSRPYLQVHWLTDVVAGTLLGAATAIGAAAIVQAWRVRRHTLSAARGQSLGPAHRIDLPSSGSSGDPQTQHDGRSGED